jgi:L-alanine-DL-glutamate epimerase-like enolase superfamily enzyme
MDNGFKFLKMDVGIGLLEGIPGALIAPPGMLKSRNVMHPFTGIQLTDKGIGLLVDYVEAVRNIVGYEIPLAVDHFGHIGIESCIRLGKALDKFSLAWYEDMIPWQFTDMWKRLSLAVDTPTCTGEDIYLKEGFMPLVQERAVSVIHPDLASSGGILETKKIGDRAQDYGVAMAIHMAESPIAAIAAAHVAAATENFMALEYHSVEVPWWEDIQVGLPKPIVKDGYITLTDKPGLGIDDLNDELLMQHLQPGVTGIWQPTDQWDDDTSWDRTWS